MTNREHYEKVIAELKARAYLPPDLFALECENRGAVLAMLHQSYERKAIYDGTAHAGDESYRFVVLRAMCGGSTEEGFCAVHPDYAGEGRGATPEEAVAALCVIGRRPGEPVTCSDLICLPDGQLRIIPTAMPQFAQHMQDFLSGPGNLLRLPILSTADPGRHADVATDAELFEVMQKVKRADSIQDGMAMLRERFLMVKL